MADIRRMGIPRTEQGRPEPERVPVEDNKSQRDVHAASDRVVVKGEEPVVESNGEAAVLPLEIESNHAEKLVAFGVFLALCYFGKLIFATMMFSLLLAFA